MEVIEKRAEEKQAPLITVFPQDISKLDDVEIGLVGTHQKYNALTAIELSKIWFKKVRNVNLEGIPERFRKGLKLVTWPGRAQELHIQNTKYADERNNNLTWYLDGAHTVESLETCADWFKSKLQANATRVLVFNCTHGRDSDRLLQVISDIQPQADFDHVVFTTNITTKNGYSKDNTSKADTLEELDNVRKSLAISWEKQVPEFKLQHIHIMDTIEEAVEFTVELSKKQKKHVQVLTTGSLIMVGNTLSVLGIEPQ